jgi:hypothetical protein
MEDNQFETYAKTYFETLVADADASLASVKTDAERYEIYLGRRNLVGGFRELMTILAEIRRDGRDSVSEHGFVALWQIMCGAHIVGTHCSFTDTIRDLVESQDQSRKRKICIEKQKPAVQAKHAEVLRLMSEIESKKPGIKKGKLADLIEAGLPKGSALGREQVLKIMRRAKKEQLTG